MLFDVFDLLFLRNNAFLKNIDAIIIFMHDRIFVCYDEN